MVLSRSVRQETKKEKIVRPRATQVDALSRLGVRVAQGFHLGKPEPLTELLSRPHASWVRRPRLIPPVTEPEDRVSEG